MLYVKETNDSFAEGLLNRLAKCSKLEDLSFMFMTPEAFPYLEEAMNFKDLSAFEKVLFTKALGKEDMEKLCHFNPFFLEEYQHFNVEVDERFVLRQMKEWMNHTHHFDKTLQVTTDFLNHYSKIDEELSLKLTEKYGELDYQKILTKIYEKGTKEQ